MALARYPFRVVDCPLSAGVPKTVLGFRGTHAVSNGAATPTYYTVDYPASMVELDVSFDGTDATQKPVLVEVYLNTGFGSSNAVASGAINTNVAQIGSNSDANYFAPMDFLYNFSAAEANVANGPNGIATNGLPSWVWRVSPAGGLLAIQWAPGEGPGASYANQMCGVRCTAASAVNVTVGVTVV